jgi:hypothetical protein
MKRFGIATISFLGNGIPGFWPDHWESSFVYRRTRQKAVTAETPQLGHAIYLFSKPASVSEFLAIYRSVTKDDIRHNRGNVAERLGFLGRLIHDHSRHAWLKTIDDFARRSRRLRGGCAGLRLRHWNVVRDNGN